MVTTDPVNVTASRAGTEASGAWILTIAVVAILLGSCSGADNTGTPGPATTQAATGEIDGSFDVGGHKLHLRCEGTGSPGSPTIVYLHGLGGDGSDVTSISPRLTSQARVCTYDRLNVGRSDRATGRHSGADSVHDLHALLGAAAVPGPYLLVGFSFGGPAGHHVRRHLPRPGHGAGQPGRQPAHRRPGRPADPQG